MQTRSLALAALLSLALAVSGSTSAQASKPTYGDPWSIEQLQDYTVFNSEIPKDQSWPMKSLALAGKAQSNVVYYLELELNQLRAKGAKNVRQVFTSKNSNLPKSWLKYIPEIRNYYLIGYADGKEVARSTILPKPRWAIASRLISLDKQNCKPIGFSIFNFDSWFSDLCSFKEASDADYLRASIWDYHTSPTELLKLEYIVQSYWNQLIACSNWDQAYTIKNGIFDCPFNKAAWGTSSFKLTYLGGLGGYKIALNPAQRTASISLFAPDYLDYAKHATLNAGSTQIHFVSTQP